MAVVYAAHDETYDRPAAVKVMQARLARSDEFRERFEREAQLANLTFNPHVLPVWDHGEDLGVFYIAAPLADTDLAGLIDREAPHGGLAAGRVARIIKQVAWALDAAHERGVVHRDVKPANILLVANDVGDEHAYLADFGIARSGALVSVTASGALAPLSIPYASPEQADGERHLTGASDQYSLACAAFEALTATVPFHEREPADVLRAHIHAAAPAVTALRAELPAGVDRVFARALAKRPQERFTSCG